MTIFAAILLNSNKFPSKKLLNINPLIFLFHPCSPVGITCHIQSPCFLSYMGLLYELQPRRRDCSNTAFVSQCSFVPTLTVNDRNNREQGEVQNWEKIQISHGFQRALRQENNILNYLEYLSCHWQPEGGSRDHHCHFLHEPK